MTCYKMFGSNCVMLLLHHEIKEKKREEYCQNKLYTLFYISKYILKRISIILCMFSRQTDTNVHSVRIISFQTLLFFSKSRQKKSNLLQRIYIFCFFVVFFFYVKYKSILETRLK